VRRAERRAELARLRAEVEDARPFAALAREIQDEVRRLADGDPATGDMVEAAIEAVPTRERIAMARALFARLPPSEQWTVLERTFDVAEIREALAEERDLQLADARRRLARGALLADVRAAGRIDTRLVPVDETLTIGLFVEADARAALGRGPDAASCARRVVVRVVGTDGGVQVIDDVFNPLGGYFVTAQYDESTWRLRDRLPPHAHVRLGSIRAGAFEPVLYPGGRVDIDRDGDAHEGMLHMGYVMIGAEDVLGEGQSEP
jgi:hypothetical protein